MIGISIKSSCQTLGLLNSYKYPYFFHKKPALKFGNGGCVVVYCIQKSQYYMATIPYTYISGTFNGLTFYVVNGRQMVRTKTSINKKRIYADPAFARLRQNSAWLQIA